MKMEFEIISKKRYLYVLFAVLLLCHFVRGCSNSSTGQQPPKDVQVPCFFIFGDSLVDNGNNNDILTLARANYQPYGIDFPQGPTGRFCNGLTVVDVLGMLFLILLSFESLIIIYIFEFYHLSFHVKVYYLAFSYYQFI